MKKQEWIVYLAQCSDDSLYCGITNNLENRLTAHNSGRGAKYTRSRRPVTVVGVSSKMIKSDALKLEYRVKRVPAEKKLSELSKCEDTGTIDVMSEIQWIRKELKILSIKIDKLRNTVESLLADL